MRLEIIQLFYENILKVRKEIVIKLINILHYEDKNLYKEHFIGNVSWGFEYLIDLL